MPAPYSPYLINIGLFQLRWYSVMIIIGIFVAIWIARRELARRGYHPALIEDFAYVVVPFGIIGARIYHVLTELDMYRDNWLAAFMIWRGGLGIYGAVILGAVGVALMARLKRVPFMVVTDCIAPGLILAQAIGRWGNYFNQEIFGPPTTLPWGLYIEPEYRPAIYAAFERFHPTFLYESLWNVAIGILLLWCSRHFWRSWLPGTLTLLYVAAYSLGRFALENLKVDTVLHVGDFRFNLLASLTAFIIFGIWFLIRLSRANSRPFPVGPRFQEHGDAASTASSTQSFQPAERRPESSSPSEGV